MYSVKGLLEKSPVQVAGVLVSLLNALVVTGVINWSSEAVAAINTSLILVLGLFVSTTTVNRAKLAELADEPVAVEEVLPDKKKGK